MLHLPSRAFHLSWLISSSRKFCGRFWGLAEVGFPLIGQFFVVAHVILRGLEPHRVCRRPFGLSYAAMAGSSSMA